MIHTDLSTANIVLDFVLIVASIWMILTVRGVGGIVGRTLSLITIGAVILGIAHLLATLFGSVLGWNAVFNNFVHRLIVLSGFVLLVFGFRQIAELKA